MHPYLRLSLGKLLLAALLFTLPTAQAYRTEGHEIIADIAQELIKGTPAEAKVHTLLAPRTMAEVSTWADQINKGDSPDTELNTWRDANRDIPSGEHSPRLNLHHYTNVPIQETEYPDHSLGTNPDDVVHALRDCILILQGLEPSASFTGTSPRVALILLIHYAGDFAQPLHLGAGFLDADLKWTNPDHEKPTESTIGGNRLQWGTTNLHYYWDDATVQGAMSAAGYPDNPSAYAQSLAQAATVENRPLPTGPVDTWPRTLVPEMLPASRRAYEDITILRREGPAWIIAPPTAAYEAEAITVTRKNLETGGLHLAQILRAIWP